jgi:hypothetical protein
VGRRPPHRRLKLRALLAALLLCGTAGCATATTPVVAPVLADRLTSALQRHDRDGFLGRFAPAADDQAAALSWYTALSAGDATIREVGPQRLQITYRLPGDRTRATDVVTYDLVDGTDRIGSVSAASTAAPLWTSGGVDLTAASSGTLLSGSLDAGAREAWARRLDRAATAVRESGVGENWTGGLVVEVPPGGRFQQVSGESASDASAVTICTSRTPRIVVNPVILGQPDEWLDSTLVHEAVHVATNSACATPGSSLGWVVEGLAESVAAASDATTASRNRELVLAYLKAHGVPDALPSQPETLTDYALAQLAVDEVRAHLGKKADDFLRRAIHDAPGVTAAELGQATTWYRSALERLDHMSR